MIPDLRIRGRAVALDEVRRAPSLDVGSYVALPDGLGAASSGTESRDKMLAHLVSCGDNAAKAREIADRTATMHDKRRNR